MWLLDFETSPIHEQIKICIYICIYISVGSRPNFRGRLIAEIFERLIDHGRPIEGKLKEKYNKKKRMKIGEEMAE